MLHRSLPSPRSRLRALQSFRRQLAHPLLYQQQRRLLPAPPAVYRAERLQEQ